MSRFILKHPGVTLMDSDEVEELRGKVASLSALLEKIEDHLPALSLDLSWEESEHFLDWTVIDGEIFVVLMEDGGPKETAEDLKVRLDTGNWLHCMPFEPDQSFAEFSPEDREELSKRAICAAEAFEALAAKMRKTSAKALSYSSDPD